MMDEGRIRFIHRQAEWHKAKAYLLAMLEWYRGDQPTEEEDETRTAVYEFIREIENK